MTDVKQALEQKAAAEKEQPVKLTKNMTILDMVKALEPEIRRALPAVLTPERFTRMALSAIHNTPELANCTPTRNPCGQIVGTPLHLPPIHAILLSAIRSGTLENTSFLRIIP